MRSIRGFPISHGDSSVIQRLGSDGCKRPAKVLASSKPAIGLRGGDQLGEEDEAASDCIGGDAAAAAAQDELIHDGNTAEAAPAGAPPPRARLAPRSLPPPERRPLHENRATRALLEEPTSELLWSGDIL